MHIDTNYLHVHHCKYRYNLQIKHGIVWRKTIFLSVLNLLSVGGFLAHPVVCHKVDIDCPFKYSFFCVRDELE